MPKMFLFLIGLSGTLFPLSALSEPTEITSPHNYQNVGALLNDIEQIRRVLGKRPPRERSFELHDAVPRQVFFQAQTLFRKCNTLAQEMAVVSREAPSPAPDRVIVSADVYGMLNDARQQLSYVKDALGITAETDAPAIQRRREPADVMHAIIAASYVLNRLTSSGPDWPQIYDRITLIMSYVGGTLPAEKRYPELRPFECCKMPQDVFDALNGAYNQAREVAAENDIGFVRIVPGKAAEGGASTSTVYDMTSILITDFAEMTLAMDGDEIDPPVYPRPARILPSHAYQLAQALSDQIARLPLE